MYLPANIQTNPANIVSITGGGLTWVKRKQVNYTMGPQCFLFGNCYVDVEIWYAIASGLLASQTFTVTYTGISAGQGYVQFLIFAISGANLSTPFDPNGSLTGVNQNTTGQPGTPTHPSITGLSTSNAPDMLLFTCFINQVTAFGGSCDLPIGSVSGAWTRVVSAYNQNIFTAFFANSAVWEQNVSILQLGVTFEVLAGGVTDTDWVLMGDAVQCGMRPPPPPLQQPQRPFAYGWPW